MSPELDKKICEQFPEIFRDRHGDMMTTAMCWGLNCGDGWFNLIRSTCHCIQEHIDNRNRNIAWAIDFNAKLDDPDHVFADYVLKEKRKVPEEIPQVVATQIKEKFGGLRFYYNGGDDYIDGVVRLAEEMSHYICEECGDKGELSGGGWLRTLCKKHQKKSGVTKFEGYF